MLGSEGGDGYHLFLMGAGLELLSVSFWGQVSGSREALNFQELRVSGIILVINL